MQSTVPSLLFSRLPALVAAGSVAADEPAPVFAAELVASDTLIDQPLAAIIPIPAASPQMAPMPWSQPDLVDEVPPVEGEIDLASRSLPIGEESDAIAELAANSSSGPTQPEIAGAPPVGAHPLSDPGPQTKPDHIDFPSQQSPAGGANAVDAERHGARPAFAPALVGADWAGSLTDESPDQVALVPGNAPAVDSRALASQGQSAIDPAHPVPAPTTSEVLSAHRGADRSRMGHMGSFAASPDRMAPVSGTALTVDGRALTSQEPSANDPAHPAPTSVRSEAQAAHEGADPSRAGQAGSFTAASPGRMAFVSGNGLAVDDRALTGQGQSAKDPAHPVPTSPASETILAHAGADRSRRGQAVRTPARTISGSPDGPQSFANMRSLAWYERSLNAAAHSLMRDPPTGQDAAAGGAGMADKTSDALKQGAAALLWPVADGAAALPVQGTSNAPVSFHGWRSENLMQSPSGAASDPENKLMPLVVTHSLVQSRPDQTSYAHSMPQDQPARQDASRTGSDADGNTSAQDTAWPSASVATRTEGNAATPHITREVAAPAPVVLAEPVPAATLPKSLPTASQPLSLPTDWQGSTSQAALRTASVAQDEAVFHGATDPLPTIAEPIDLAGRSQHPTAQETALRLRWASEKALPLAISGEARALPEMPEQGAVPDRKHGRPPTETRVSGQNDHRPLHVEPRQSPPMTREAPTAPLEGPAGLPEFVSPAQSPGLSKPVGSQARSEGLSNAAQREVEAQAVKDQRHSPHPDRQPPLALGVPTDEAGSRPMPRASTAFNADESQGAEPDRFSTAWRSGDDRLPENGGARGSAASEQWLAQPIPFSSTAAATIADGSPQAVTALAPLSDLPPAHRVLGPTETSGASANSTTPAQSAAQQASSALAQLSPLQPGRIELTLAPETLGRLHFDMQPDGAGLSITLSAERADTLDLMRRNLPDLLAELRQAGVQAGTLSFGTWSDGRHAPQPARIDPEQAFVAQAETPRSIQQTAKRPASTRGLDLRL